jgi:hypothetical protein
MGVVGLVSGAALAFAATVLEVPWWSRVIVFFPLWLGGVGLLDRGRAEDFHRTNRRAIYLAGALTAVLLLLAV